MNRSLLLPVVEAMFAMSMLPACEILDNDPNKHVNNADSTEIVKDSAIIGLDEVATLMSSLPLQPLHIFEVHDAVTSSSDNGYDKEYTMKNLFVLPGAGVGDSPTKAADNYEEPLRELIENHVRTGFVTKSGEIADADKFLEALEQSDIQIYWPNPESWDGETLPVITFDPEDGSEVNIGYMFVNDDDGFRRVEEVDVDEGFVEAYPVWVVNRNSDAGYTSLELMRREDPNWGEGGGNIIIKPKGMAATKTGEETAQALMLKDFTMNRHYDTWFAGASEFFVKIGYLKDFTASTDAELKLYNPEITDLMIVVKRDQLGISQSINALLMSSWNDEEDGECAFMITEDDGGTKESWTAKAKVYVHGKSYGAEITIPLNTKDDIVWRGKLDYKWMKSYSGKVSPFVDVDIVFEIIEYQ